MTYNRVWAIGDVHDNYIPLKRLVAQIPLTDHLVFVGDLTHKGNPQDSPMVVELVKGLVEAGRASCVQGNHDAKASRGKNPEDQFLTPEHLTFLKGLPVALKWDGLLFLHGGVDANVKFALTNMEMGDFWNSSGIKGKAKKKLEKARFVRFLDGEGKMIYENREVIGVDPFWAAEYDGSFGTVVFGHNPWTSPALFPHAVGVDCGAGWSGELSMGPQDPKVVGGETPLPDLGRGLVAVPFVGGQPVWSDVLMEECQQNPDPSLREMIEGDFSLDQVESKVKDILASGRSLKPALQELLDSRRLAG